MESPRQPVLSMLAADSFSITQQLESDTTTFSSGTLLPQRSLSDSPPVSESTTVHSASPIAMEENAVLAAQLLASTVAAVDEKEEQRPSLSYKDLIIEAIESSPEKRLKLSEIYQVIKYIHPYYKKRSDQWGWQNSIRHNLSLHDCFVKLPLKQTSASGVVGHFWTVIRETEDKQSSSRRRNRNNNSGTRLTRCSSGKVASSTLKGKGRQSVSSDSSVMSDESQANSPTVLLLDGMAVRKDTVIGGSQLSSVASMPQLHRPVPYLPDIQQKQADQPLANQSNLLTSMALNSLVNTPTSTPSKNLLGLYNEFASSVLLSSALLSRATNNNISPVNPLPLPVSAIESPLVGLNDNLEQLQRLQMFNSTLYQNNPLVEQAINQAHLFEQKRQKIQSASLLINQLLTLKNQLAKPATLFFMPQQQQPTLPQMPASNTLQHQLIHLLNQQVFNPSSLVSTSNVMETIESEPADPTTSKDEDLSLVV